MTRWKVFLIGIPGLLLLLFGLFQDFPRLQFHYWLIQWLNFAHVILFFTLTWVVQAMWWSGVLWYRRLLKALLMTVVIGLFIEIVQFYSGRSMSINDIAANCVGAGLAVVWAGQGGISSRALVFSKAMFLMAAIGLTGSPLWATAKIVTAHVRLPLLSDLESVLDSDRWYGSQIKVARLENGHAALEKVFESARFDSFGINDFPADWRNYHCLEFEVINPERLPQTLSLRINDQKHDLGEQRYVDRFNQRFELLPGSNRVHIPLKSIENAPRRRLMDMSRIARILFFGVKPTAGFRVYLDEIKLSEASC